MSATDQNPAIFPDLLRDKKIMYVHGFCSSAFPEGGTIERLKRAFPCATVVAEDIPLHPQEGLAMLQEMTAREQPDLIVGSSMGGMYAEQLKGFDRILINPAFRMGDTMQEHGFMGPQTYFKPRRDGVQHFIVTEELVQAYRDLSAQCFQNITPEEQRHVFGLFGEQDPLVHTWDLFCTHYPQAVRCRGGHQLDDFMFLHGMLPMIREIAARQAVVPPANE